MRDGMFGFLVVFYGVPAAAFGLAIWFLFSNRARAASRASSATSLENDNMNGEQIGSIIRAILSAVGGYFVGKGIIDASTMTAIVGALATIGVAIWGIVTKTNTAMVSSAATVPGVTIQAPASIANAIPASNVTPN